MINIVHKLRLAKGTNRKLTILIKEKDNEDWKTILKAMYDTSINYYISSPSDNSFISRSFTAKDIIDHLEWLSSRTVTGNDARAHALEGSRQFGEIYRLVLGGSLKAGVSITTINKAYPGLIPQFKVMLANDVPITHFPCIASTKYDGVRLLAFVSDAVDSAGITQSMVKLVLRSGKQIHIKSLEYEMSKQPPGVYDGELVAGDGLQEGRTKITGSVNRCLKGGATDIKDYTFCIFDYLLHEEWAAEVSGPYIERVQELNKMTQNSKVRIADMYTMGSIDHVNELYAQKLAAGYEGLIIRQTYDPYEWKRSNKLIKKKAIFEGVLECYDTTEGTNKYEGMIGALMLRGTIDDKDILVKTGSGLSDHDREMPPQHFIGKDIEMLYNDITRAKDASHYSLFIPRFKRVKGDHNV